MSILRTLIFQVHNPSKRTAAMLHRSLRSYTCAARAVLGAAERDWEELRSASLFVLVDCAGGHQIREQHAVPLTKPMRSIFCSEPGWVPSHPDRGSAVSMNPTPSPVRTEG